MIGPSGGDAVLSLVLDAVQGGRTGAIEWRNDPRRRLFFFESGQLVLVQSNLKSESAARVIEQEPTLQGSALTARVADVRFREQVGEPAGTVTWHAGAAAPQRESVDVVRLLWSVAERLPALPDQAWPTLARASAAVIDRLPVEPEVRAYLLELDGTRPIEDVLAFGPADPTRLAAALGVGVAVGAVELVDAPLASVVASAAGSAPVAVGQAEGNAPLSAAPAAPIDLDDIAGFIQDALDGPEGLAAPLPAAPERPVPLADDEDMNDTYIVRLPKSGAVPAATVDPVVARFGPKAARIRAAKDHFATLGVAHTDPPDVLRRAYFQLARDFHPDQLGDTGPQVQEGATELFDRVRAAWEVLGDDAKREAYIARTIRGEKTEDEKAMERVRAIMDAENDFKRGVAELTAGRLPAAHELFGRARATMPEEVEYAAYHGYTSFKLAHGRDQAAADEGFDQLRAALKTNDKMDGAWVLLGMALRARGNDGAARTAFVTALKLKPANPDAVREMRRLERDKEAPPAAGAGGLFSRLFGRK
jgi:curved DNA-binding protein CbpA